MLWTPFYYIFVLISLLLPGYVVLKKIKCFSNNLGVELSVGYLLTIVFYAALATLDYALKLSPLLTRTFCWLILVVALVELIRSHYYKDLWKLRFPLFCLVAMSALATLFIGLSFSSKYTIVPDPTPAPNANYQVLNVKVLNVSQTQANDNYVPYRQAQFFVNRLDPAKDSFIAEWGVGFFERTPLMGAVTANYFNLLDEKPPIDLSWSPTATDPDHTYLQFQLLAQVLNSIFIIPSFFLLKKLFNRKTALLTSLFLIPSPFFLYNAVFSWPKSLVAFSILLAWLLLLEKKWGYTITAGITCGIAYLTHDLAILYIGATVIFLLANRRIKDAAWLVIAPLFFALPWLFIASKVYHQTSSFIYYPISTKGIPQPQESKQIVHQFLHTSVFKLIYIRLQNIFYLLSPYQLLTSEDGQSLSRRFWALGLFSIPGSLGIGLLPSVFIAAFKRLEGWGFWILALVPVLLESLFIGWPKGLGALHFAEAIVVLLSGLSIYYLSRLKSSKWLMGAFALNCLQLIFFVTYSYKFTIGVWFTDPKDIAIIMLMVTLVVVCGFMIYKIAHIREANNKHFLRLFGDL